MYYITIFLTYLTYLVYSNLVPNSTSAMDSSNIVENTKKSSNEYDIIEMKKKHDEYKKIYDEYKKDKLNQMIIEIKKYHKRKQLVDNTDTSIVYFKLPCKLNGKGVFMSVKYIIKNISDNELEQLELFIEDNNKKIISDFVILNSFGICIKANKNFKKIPKRFEICKERLRDQLCAYSRISIIDFSNARSRQQFTSFVCKMICRNKDDYDFFSNMFYLIK